MAEFLLKKAEKISEGQHVGVIIGIEYRTVPYNYTDLTIETGEKFQLKVGFPTTMSDESLLGKLCMLMGAKVGESIDPQKLLVGRKVSFLVMNKENKKKGGLYPNIIPASVKPVA